MQQRVFYLNESAVYGTWSICACSLGRTWWVDLNPLLFQHHPTADLSSHGWVRHLLLLLHCFHPAFIILGTIQTNYNPRISIQKRFIPTMSRLWSPVDEFQFRILLPVFLTRSFPNKTEFWNHFIHTSTQQSGISDICLILISVKKKKGKQRCKNVMKD